MGRSRFQSLLGPSAPRVLCEGTSLLYAVSPAAQGGRGRGETQQASALVLSAGGLKQRAFCTGPGPLDSWVQRTQGRSVLPAPGSQGPRLPGHLAWQLLSTHFPRSQRGRTRRTRCPGDRLRASQRCRRGSGSRSQKLGAGDPPAWPAWEGGGFQAWGASRGKADQEIRTEPPPASCSSRGAQRPLLSTEEATAPKSGAF